MAYEREPKTSEESILFVIIYKAVEEAETVDANKVLNICERLGGKFWMNEQIMRVKDMALEEAESEAGEEDGE